MCCALMWLVVWQQINMRPVVMQNDKNAKQNIITAQQYLLQQIF